MFMRRLRFWLPLLSLAMLAGSLAVLAFSITTPCQVRVSLADRRSDAYAVHTPAARKQLPA